MCFLVLESAKCADARRQTEKELGEALGGELDTATVLRAFLSRKELLTGTSLKGFDDFRDSISCSQGPIHKF